MCQRQGPAPSRRLGRAVNHSCAVAHLKVSFAFGLDRATLTVLPATLSPETTVSV